MPVVETQARPVHLAGDSFRFAFKWRWRMMNQTYLISRVYYFLSPVVGYLPIFRRMMDGLVAWNISPRARIQAIIIESSSQFLVNIISKVSFFGCNLWI
jgi:hypothetical protein